MKKMIFMALLFSMTIALQAQIYVDNKGNVYDQRKSSTTTATSAKSNNRSSSGSSFDMSKLSFGGNLSLQFGDYTVVGISPAGRIRFQ